MTKALETALKSAKEWLEGLDDRPVEARAGLSDLLSRFEGPLPEAGMLPEDVVSHLTADTRARGINDIACCDTWL